MSKEKSCAFTGHRNVRDDLDLNKLTSVIKILIDNGVTTFYNGMARGFDLIAAECVLKLKKEYPQIKLIACVPCPDQEKYYSNEDKITYYKVLKACDEMKVLSNRYNKGCMLMRDRFMVDNSSHLIAYYRGEDGGTRYTLNYANTYEDKIKIYLV
ncbi:MAG: SLOG family protein [Candidatus Coproplasma sp.]